MGNVKRTEIHDARDTLMDARGCHGDMKLALLSGEVQRFLRAWDKADAHYRSAISFIEKLCKPTPNRLAKA